MTGLAALQLNHVDLAKETAILTVSVLATWCVGTAIVKSLEDFGWTVVKLLKQSQPHLMVKVTKTMQIIIKSNVMICYNFVMRHFSVSGKL